MSSRTPHGGLWQCPSCGNLFVTANLWHSCGRWTLESHFAGKDPVVRRIFDRYLEVVRSFGPVRLIPQKTRITFQVRVRFAGCVTRKRWIEANFWLTRPVDSPRIVRREEPLRECHIHYVKLASVKEMDSELTGWLRESYRVGCQEHRKQPRKAPRKGP